ncbi:MAG: N-acetyltransferase [Firmicutes bacterium]|nr:N-acetyltransferase [Bacillota bacterium]
MEHIKTMYSKKIATDVGEIVIEGPVPSDIMREYSFHDGLRAFREPKGQFKAILEIAELAEGRIIIARKEKVIVGYATLLYPEVPERWAEGDMDDLLELGAIEVALDYRKYSLGKNILAVAMLDPYMEHYIVISTECYWHWDLSHSGLDIWEYRSVMERTMAAGGLKWLTTDDPEINAHPANCLMARVGKHVPATSVVKFDQLRFKYKTMY